MSQEDLYYLLGMAGTVAFAVTAVLAVTPKNIDLFGACVMGLVTAVGGGTIRDLILEVPVFWSLDLNYLWVALASSVVAFYGNRLMDRKYVYLLMLYLDGLGVAMFVIQGAEKARLLEFGLPLGPVILGITTAIGGGVIRDLLAGNTTLFMRKELYALPLTVGVVAYMLLVGYFPEKVSLISTTCATFTFLFRAGAIYWRWHVPSWMLIKPNKTEQ